ncbi:hypothetical protein EBR03_08605 [bacterium]|nr:hypothetical protein [bacterium]NBW99617.1 hypothetical protein [bacterium]NBX83054.1 hypothetical protein [bacterium]
MITELHTSKRNSANALYPDFVAIVDELIELVDQKDLETLRKDFHTRLRMTLSQPERAELVEDLWDFFYDWCLFEKEIPGQLEKLSSKGQGLWAQLKTGNLRGLYHVQKINDDGLKLKELFTSKTHFVPRKYDTDFLGLQKGDLIEGRLIPDASGEVEGSAFVRRPSYHPVEVHDYIKSKVKQFKKDKDFETYQSWLWLLVGMYLKYRMYEHMPIDKIYDDNSRI